MSSEVLQVKEKYLNLTKLPKDKRQSLAYCILGSIRDALVYDPSELVSSTQYGGKQGNIGLLKPNLKVKRQTYENPILRPAKPPG